MKKLLLICILLSSIHGNSQSVDRNDFVISIAPGAAIINYGKPDTGSFQPRSGYWAVRVPVSLEYSLSRSFGISADFIYTRPRVESMLPSTFNVVDIGIGLRMHSPSTDRKVDWFGEIGVHYSNLNYFYHGDFYHETNTGKGWSLFYELGANVPLSSSEKFGMGISLNGSGYNYFSVFREFDSGANHYYKMKALSFSTGINFYYKL